MNKRFEYVMIVSSIEEAEYEARKLGLTRADFRYCTEKSQLVGYRLPTNRLLFISEKLDKEMTYLDKDGKLQRRLNDRFHTIINGESFA
ncbi:MAG: hypothetical protein RI930_216 [Pseudomonadota bacterium]|jgi:hypothetical protein